MAALFKVVLTGGPCAGKTTMQALLTDTFENIGWKVYRVSEVASFLLGGGVDFSLLSVEHALKFQENVLLAILAVERVYVDLAVATVSQGQNILIICDRGALDASAYVDASSWEEILRRLSCTELDLRDNRYDCVVHMKSAACGAQQFYKNDLIRKEDINLAQIIDQRILEAWMGHPHFSLIDNSTDFDTKLRRTLQTILSRLGLADRRSSSLRRRRFVLEEVRIPPDLPVRNFDVEYLLLCPAADGTQQRLRRRGCNGQYVYTLIMIQFTGSQQQIETRRNLHIREYESMTHLADTSKQPIVKKRSCFVWNDIYCQIDGHVTPHPDLILLEVYQPNTCSEPCVPPFLTISREVTDDPSFKLTSLAMK